VCSLSSQINKVQANHPPIAYNQNITTNGNRYTFLKLEGNDPDGDPITFSIRTKPLHGNASDFAAQFPETGKIVYDSGNNAKVRRISNDSFSFQVKDNHNATSNIAKVFINVIAVPNQEQTSIPSEKNTFSPSTQSQEDQNSLVGTYAQGYDAGKDAAFNTHNSGGSRDSTCPPSHSLAYCTGYKVGYNWEWGKLGLGNVLSGLLSGK
jgi:Big-like domain-containing protein